MPIHDWTRLPSGLFHDFHQARSIEIRNALNRGLLPKDLYALVEQKVDGPEPIAVEAKNRDKSPVGAATLTPPQTALSARIRSDAARYARRANRISVRHAFGEVAVFESVSPGNKDSRNSLTSIDVPGDVGRVPGAGPRAR
ncbi:MAG: hypothetical protein K2V38_20250 [Gemmataceae bacterium]|nr:hypothetical protein [Gemmataceae bacterium]